MTRPQPEQPEPADAVDATSGTPEKSATKRKTPRRFDPYVLVLITILVLGILIPLPHAAVNAISVIATVAVSLLFLIYGARLPTSEVWAGIRNWKLQLATLCATFVVFPLIGIATHHLLIPLVGVNFAIGFLFLTLLPSTVNSSVTFTSIAGGNVSAAVCAATISNILGMFLTPALAALTIHSTNAGINMGAFTDVLLKLLLPFIVGQLVQPKIGVRLRQHKNVTDFTDRATIALIVASAVTGATARGLWHTVTGMNIAVLIIAAIILLAVMLTFTWTVSGLLKLKRADRIVVLMCGSKKSLTSGLPIAAVIFPPALTAAVTIPVLVFHQIQIFTCAIIAQRMSRNSGGARR